MIKASPSAVLKVTEEEGLWVEEVVERERVEASKVEAPEPLNFWRSRVNAQSFANETTPRGKDVRPGTSLNLIWERQFTNISCVQKK